MKLTQWVRSHHILGFEIFVNALWAAFSTETRSLDPTKRCRGIRDQTGVQASHAGVKGLNETTTALEVLGEGIAHKAILGGIG